MLSHTKSYETFRKQGVEIINHCVLLSFALPYIDAALKNMKGPVKGILPDSKFFNNHTIEAQDLNKRIQDAENIVGKELLISTFSYFEAYIKNLFNEILKFHGGADRIRENFDIHIKHSDALMKNDDLRKTKRKIQDNFDKQKLDKYRKHSRVLRDEGFLLPSQRMAFYGWITLKKDLEDFKAYKIESLLMDGLMLAFTKEKLKNLKDIREARNKVAHGKLTKYPVSKAIENGSFLRDLALEIDKHVLENFMLAEVY